MAGAEAGADGGGPIGPRHDRSRHGPAAGNAAGVPTDVARRRTAAVRSTGCRRGWPAGPADPAAPGRRGRRDQDGPPGSDGRRAGCRSWSRSPCVRRRLVARPSRRPVRQDRAGAGRSVAAGAGVLGGVPACHPGQWSASLAAASCAAPEPFERSSESRRVRRVTRASSGRSRHRYSWLHSSGSSALRATATIVTPSGRFISRTPMVCRCARRTSRALVRITPPLDVIAYTSSSGRTASAPTSPPRVDTIRAVSTPLPPRPCSGYSSSRRALGVSALGRDQDLDALRRPPHGQQLVPAAEPHADHAATSRGPSAAATRRRP